MLLLGLKSVFVMCLCYAIMSDFSRLIIPNWIIAILVSDFAILAAISMEPWPILVHVAVAAVVLVLFSAFFVVGWMAGGDVKLIAAVALWAGLESTGTFVLLMALLGSLLALALLAIKKHGHRASGLLADNRLFQRARCLAEHSHCPYGVAIGAAALALCSSILQ
jgi:prepilin peptidase CpaA